MGRTTLIIEKDAVLISQPQQQCLFTSNQEEADTRIAWLRKQQASFAESKSYRYINFNGVCFCFNFSTI